ncbi:MAG: hypothetical protein M1832_000418 [Thelocarpon impressellum]|nr:MAG: hypothetical protein M1832_000418 [Thelocarpon impressellum]
MRLQSALVCTLPLLVAAQAEQQQQQQQQQKPLGGLLEKLQSYIPPQAYAVLAKLAPGLATGPVQEAAARVAAKNVTPLTLENWRDTLTAGEAVSREAEPKVWWVYVTGGNKTCLGQCDRADKAWNESAMRLATTSSSPHLASINCDAAPVLCNSWSAGAPAIWHITRPATADAKTDIRILPLNATTVTSAEIMRVHGAQTWKDAPLYEGPFHPFDGIVAKLGLSQAVGYVLWAFAIVPSWAFMLVISLFSRSFMWVFRERIPTRADILAGAEECRRLAGRRRPERRRRIET